MFCFPIPAAKAFRPAVLFLFASVLAYPAAVTVSPTVTSLGGGVFQYAYSISNTGPEAVVIDIPVPASPSAVTNIIAPAGFQDAFDSVLGLVSFLEDTSSFTATPTPGFSFDSLSGPGAATFVATLFDGSTVSGSTTAPTSAATATPEPSYFYLFSFLAPALFIIKRRNAGQANMLPETNNLSENSYARND